MDISTDAFTALPDPGHAKSLDELTERLRLLKVWAGNPSYETIARGPDRGATGVRPGQGAEQPA